MPRQYNWGGGANSSRWEYVEDLLNHCIGSGKCNEVLKYLFQKKKFDKQLSDCGKKEFESAYKIFVDAIIDKISRHLEYSNHELIVVSGNFIIKSSSEKIDIEIPKINNVDRNFIKEIHKRAIKAIDEGDFDSAVTKARTLLEEVFFRMIEKKGGKASRKGDIGILYKQVRELYSMQTDKELDKRINMLLSGLNNIVSAVADMRNISGDAHGLGAGRIYIKDYHARLVVNAAAVMADFILAVAENCNK